MGDQERENSPLQRGPSNLLEDLGDLDFTHGTSGAIERH